VCVYIYMHICMYVCMYVYGHLESPKHKPSKLITSFTNIKKIRHVDTDILGRRIIHNATPYFSYTNKVFHALYHISTELWLYSITVFVQFTVTLVRFQNCCYLRHQLYGCTKLTISLMIC